MKELLKEKDMKLFDFKSCTKILYAIHFRMSSLGKMVNKKKIRKY